MARPNRIPALAFVLALLAVAFLAPSPAAAAAKGSHGKRTAHRAEARAKAHRAERRHARAMRRRGARRKLRGLAPRQSVRSAVAVSSKASTPGLLFHGVHIGDFAMNQSAPGAVTEVPDPTDSGEPALQMTVSDQDVAPITPTENPRAQLLSPAILNPGDEFWWSSKFYLPTDFPSSVPGWLTLMQGPYGPPFNGTPSWHLEVNGSQIEWSRNGTYNWDVPWHMPLVRGSWVNVLVHIGFASDGFVEMWIDGQQVTFFEPGSYNPNHESSTQRLEMQTLDQSNNGGPNYAAIQSYRKVGMFQSVSLLQGPMTLGTTRASVEG
jgi:Polysaccharide lyase